MPVLKLKITNTWSLLCYASSINSSEARDIFNSTIYRPKLVVNVKFNNCVILTEINSSSFNVQFRFLVK